MSQGAPHWPPRSDLDTEEVRIALHSDLAATQRLTSRLSRTQSRYLLAELRKKADAVASKVTPPEESA